MVVGGAPAAAQQPEAVVQPGDDLRHRQHMEPGLNQAVIDRAHAAGALAFLGALTPTEIIAAWRGGADVVKVFPARALGPRYIADVRAPLPAIPLMPTGGVDETNAAAYLRAGAVAAAVGGNLIDPAAIDRCDWASLTRRARDFVAAARVDVDVPLSMRRATAMSVGSVGRRIRLDQLGKDMHGHTVDQGHIARLQIAYVAYPPRLVSFCLHERRVLISP